MHSHLYAVIVIEKGIWDPHVVHIMRICICGGFKTSSTFALETSNLLKNVQTPTAFLNNSEHILPVAVFFAALKIGKIPDYLIFRT